MTQEGCWYFNYSLYQSAKQHLTLCAKVHIIKTQVGTRCRKVGC
nr:MAG TPA: hypothetical protein [Caudoviricetes sp.]